MTAFLAIAMLLVVSASLVLALAVRRAGRGGIDRAAINVALYREREAEIAAECASGRIEPARRDALLAELRRLLVDDVEGDGAASSGDLVSPTRFDRALPWLLLAFVPALSLGIYLATGADVETRAWLSLESRAGEIAALPRPLGEASVGKLGMSLADAARLTQAGLDRRPADAEAWLQLGFTWLDLRAAGPGVESIRMAHRLAPERTDVSLALARVLIAVEGGRLDDESRALFEDVLAREPGHQGALMFYGIAAFESGEYALAAKRWGELLEMLDPASEAARLLRASIARATGEGGQLAAPAMPMRVRVTIDPSAGSVPAGATLFVVARAAGGQPMPLAVKRLPAVFPVDTTISDQDLLAPGAALSSRGPLELSARVSLTGDAMPASGDIGGEPVRVVQPAKDPVVLRLDRRLP